MQPSKYLLSLQRNGTLEVRFPVRYLAKFKARHLNTNQQRTTETNSSPPKLTKHPNKTRTIKNKQTTQNNPPTRPNYWKFISNLSVQLHEWPLQFCCRASSSTFYTSLGFPGRDSLHIHHHSLLYPSLVEMQTSWNLLLLFPFLLDITDSHGCKHEMHSTLLFFSIQEFWFHLKSWGICNMNIHLSSPHLFLSCHLILHFFLSCFSTGQSSQIFSHFISNMSWETRTSQQSIRPWFVSSVSELKYNIVIGEIIKLGKGRLDWDHTVVCKIHTYILYCFLFIAFSSDSQSMRASHCLKPFLPTVWAPSCLTWGKCDIQPCIARVESSKLQLQKAVGLFHLNNSM